MDANPSSSSLSGVESAGVGIHQNSFHGPEWDNDEYNEEDEEFMSDDEYADDDNAAYAHKLALNGVGHQLIPSSARKNNNPSGGSAASKDDRGLSSASNKPPARSATEFGGVAAATSSRQSEDTLRRFVEEQVQKAKSMNAAATQGAALNFVSSTLTKSNSVVTNSKPAARSGGLMPGSELEDFVNQQIQKAQLHKTDKSMMPSSSHERRNEEMEDYDSDEDYEGMMDEDEEEGLDSDQEEELYGSAAGMSKDSQLQMIARQQLQKASAGNIRGRGLSRGGAGGNLSRPPPGNDAFSQPGGVARGGIPVGRGVPPRSTVDQRLDALRGMRPRNIVNHGASPTDDRFGNSGQRGAFPSASRGNPRQPGVNHRAPAPMGSVPLRSSAPSPSAIVAPRGQPPPHPRETAKNPTDIQEYVNAQVLKAKALAVNSSRDAKTSAPQSSAGMQNISQLRASSSQPRALLQNAASVVNHAETRPRLPAPVRVGASRRDGDSQRAGDFQQSAEKTSMNETKREAGSDYLNNESDLQAFVKEQLAKVMNFPVNDTSGSKSYVAKRGDDSANNAASSRREVTLGKKSVGDKQVQRDAKKEEIPKDIVATTFDEPSKTDDLDEEWCVDQERAAPLSDALSVCQEDKTEGPSIAAIAPVMSRQTTSDRNTPPVRPTPGAATPGGRTLIKNAPDVDAPVSTEGGAVAEQAAVTRDAEKEDAMGEGVDLEEEVVEEDVEGQEEEMEEDGKKKKVPTATLR